MINMWWILMGISFVIDIVREIIGWKYAKIGMIGCRMIIREVLEYGGGVVSKIDKKFNKRDMERY